MKHVASLALFSFLFCLKADAQVDNFPYYVHIDNSDGIKMNHYNGFVVTTTNDTIQGIIILNHPKNKAKAIDIETSGATHSISSSTIKLVRIQEVDTTIIKTPYTDFYFFENKMYRLLADGYFKVFDNLSYVKEKIGSLGNEIYIMENAMMINTFNFWTANTKRDLLKYVNKRFNKKFKASDFANSVELINYISAQKK
jgi:hypothetical protein